MPSLLDPLRVGALDLPNRVVMAPLTRSRAGVVRVPNALMAEYYRQRASFGLIITEATSVTPMGVGYHDTPGIWSAEQVEGWKLTTKAVHEAGGRIVLQLWHVGRTSDPFYLNGETPVAPSAIAIADTIDRVAPGKPYVTPRALAVAELPGIVDAYRKGAENAQKAGFDGVEIHGANGYLLDSFLQSKSNIRTDEYGGTVENRARLMLEVTDAVTAVWGADRVGMHLSPRGDNASMGDANPALTFSYVGKELGKRKLAFICAREYVGPDSVGPQIKAAFGGVYIANEKFFFDDATAALAEGRADAVAFGKLAIANPDLALRLALNAPLNEWDASTFYTGADGYGGAKGYTDYPSLG